MVVRDPVPALQSDESLNANEARETGPFSCPNSHDHGSTSVCYSDHRCRCADCKERRFQDWRQYKERRETGTVQELKPAGPARKHVRHLMSLGWRYADIVKVSGVSQPTLYRVANGRVKNVLPETFDAILGTKPEMRHKGLPPAEVDATGTTRRIQALSAQGWTHTYIGELIGKSQSAVYWIMRQGRVTVDTAEKVKAVYDALWDKRPPQGSPEELRVFRRSVAHAKRQGWLGPLAWDDETIDDPAAVPDTGHVSRRGFMSRHDPEAVADALDGIPTDLSPLERREVVTVLNARRWAAHRIAQYAGCDVKTVERIREELGLPVPTHNQIRDAA